MCGFQSTDFAEFVFFYYAATGNGLRSCLKFIKTSRAILLNEQSTGLIISFGIMEHNIYVLLFTPFLYISISYWILPLLYCLVLPYSATFCPG